MSVYSYAEVIIADERPQISGLYHPLRAYEQGRILPCQTYCDMGPIFLSSDLKDRPI